MMRPGRERTYQHDIDDALGKAFAFSRLLCCTAFPECLLDARGEEVARVHAQLSGSAGFCRTASVCSVVPAFRDKPAGLASTLPAVEDVEHEPDACGSLGELFHFSTTMDMGGSVSWSPCKITAAPVVDRYP